MYGKQFCIFLVSVNVKINKRVGDEYIEITQWRKFDNIVFKRKKILKSLMVSLYIPKKRENQGAA